MRAISASNAWAVGEWINGTTGGLDTELERNWVGPPAQPQPERGQSRLVGVAAAGPGDVWVGDYLRTTSSPYQSLALHCC